MIERRLPHSHPTGRPVVDGGDEAQATVYAAIEVLQSERQVTESAAYMVLVMASIHEGLSVREAARQIAERAASARRH
jgi:hypothetical protein